MEDKLRQIESHISRTLDSLNHPQVSRFCAALSQGKMLRSKLMLAICPRHHKIIELCAIVEMIQSASLLHDDVIDEASMRRGRDSINALFGNKNAIMLGDVFYAQAFYDLVDFDARIAKSIAGCVVRLSCGEMDDVMMSQSFQENKERYLKMIGDKTASLIAASSESAAILAGLDAKAYRIYGENLGLAFQIVDDMLDVFGDEKTLGKPAMSDYAEGKVTLPYLLLLECLDLAKKQRLRSYFKQNHQEARIWILQQMREHEIFNQTQEIAREYGLKALAAIDGNARLEQIVKDMIFRHF